MRTNYISILLIMALLLCGSCSDNEPELAAESTTSTVTIRTRAPQDNEANATTDELINTWWMVFVDEQGADKGKVRLILDRPSETDAVSSEEVKFTIPRGTYTIYAFANITRESLTQTPLNLTFTEGAAAPDLSTVQWNRIGKIGDLIPMTGVLHNVSLTKEMNNTFSIEVVRLWAKLCFQFSTDTDKTITVSKLSMMPALNESGVTLLPDYTSLGGAPSLPDRTNCSLLERKDLNLTITKDATASETFYLLESTAASHPTGHYPLSFELKYGDGATRTVNALAYELKHINRNDFITIPILITDWTVAVGVLFYPPIGGYPAVLLEESKDNEFYATFGSPGKFVIRPTVTSADGTIVANSDLAITLTAEDTSGILSQKPTYDDKSFEIIEEIAPGKGTAVVTLDIGIKVNNTVQQTIKRKFYIIRKDS